MDWFEISEDLKKFICNGFELIRNSPDFTEKQKFQLTDRLLSMGAGVGWRPKAISINALKLFVKNDFKKPKGLERAHVHHRRHTLNELLKKVGKMMSGGIGIKKETILYCLHEKKIGKKKIFIK